MHVDVMATVMDGLREDAKNAGVETATMGSDMPVDDNVSAVMSTPKNKEEVLQQVNLEGLPNSPTEQIIKLLCGKNDVLVKVFAHYCKFAAKQEQALPSALEKPKRRRREQ